MMNSETRMNDEEEHIITNKQEDNAIIAFLCGLLIALSILFAACMRGCHPEPTVVADCICEQCGEIIGAEDHGRCQEMQVASINLVK